MASKSKRDSKNIHMTTSNVQLGFFISLAIIALTFTLWLFIPFIAPILLAAVFAIVFYPLHRRFARLIPRWPSITAFISTLLILLIIIGPLIFFGWLVFQESIGVYRSIVNEGNGIHILPDVISRLEGTIESLLGIGKLNFDTYVNAEEIVLAILTWIHTHIGELFSRVVEYSVGLFILVLALFSFLRDGETLVKGMVKISPLGDTFDKQIMKRVSTAVNSVIVGEVVIALLQGILTGLGFWIFGVPNAAIWGFLAAIAAFIPTFGTALILIPGILYLTFLVDWIPAIGLLLWGSVLVGLVDNVLRPIVIDKGMHIHPFLILIAVLGGISVFGPIGFVAGPVILGFLFALLDIYPFIVKKLAED